MANRNVVSITNIRNNETFNTVEVPRLWDKLFVKIPHHHNRKTRRKSQRINQLQNRDLLVSHYYAWIMPPFFVMIQLTDITIVAGVTSTEDSSHIL